MMITIKKEFTTIVSYAGIVKTDIKNFTEIAGGIDFEYITKDQLLLLYDAGFVYFSKSEPTFHCLQTMKFLHKSDDCVDSICKDGVSCVVNRNWRKANFGI